MSVTFNKSTPIKLKIMQNPKIWNFSKLVLKLQIKLALHFCLYQENLLVKEILFKVLLELTAVQVETALDMAIIEIVIHKIRKN